MPFCVDLSLSWGLQISYIVNPAYLKSILMIQHRRYLVQQTLDIEQFGPDTQHQLKLRSVYKYGISVAFNCFQPKTFVKNVQSLERLYTSLELNLLSSDPVVFVIHCQLHCARLIENFCIWPFSTDFSFLSHKKQLLFEG